MVAYRTIFVDIGGVLLSNGWDHALREKAAQKFQLDLVELNKRHAIIFDTYEIGKITFDEYLDRVVFFTKRPFSHQEFKEYLFSQAYALPNMLHFLGELKKKFPIHIVAVSNEGRELMEDRIKRFRLKETIDFFVCSGFVGLRKPDYDIYRLALDLSQSQPEEVIYIDDRPILVEIGRELGLFSILHVSFAETQKMLGGLLVNPM